MLSPLRILLVLTFVLLLTYGLVCGFVRSAGQRRGDNVPARFASWTIPQPERPRLSVVAFRTEPGLDSNETVVIGRVRNEGVVEAKEAEVLVLWDTRGMTGHFRKVPTDPQTIPPGREAGFRARIEAKDADNWQAQVSGGSLVRASGSQDARVARPATGGRRPQEHVESDEVSERDVLRCLTFTWSVQNDESATTVPIQVVGTNGCDKPLPRPLSRFRVAAIGTSGSKLAEEVGQLDQALRPGGQASTTVVLTCDRTRVASYSITAWP